MASVLSRGGFIGCTGDAENIVRAFKALDESTQVFSPVKGSRKFIAPGAFGARAEVLGALDLRLRPPRLEH